MNRVLPEEAATVHLESLAVYAFQFGPDTGGEHLRSALLVEILVHRHGVDVFEAIRLIREEWWNLRVVEAGTERERLLVQARRACLAFEQDGAA